ncbi:MAG: M48 family metalloprotease [Saprospiraceae bacterium]|nr:M48 family metalloprotease [Saprospiraceae bacterium]
MRINYLSQLKYFLMVWLFLAIGACAVNPVTGEKELMLLSEADEKAMGQQYDPSVVASFGLYPDTRLQEFIDEKGKQMAALSHRPDLGYEFKILDSPVINAFAVPGGYVYFTRGILAHFNNEAEFAGVLGHEIGHITARHTAKQYSRQMIAQLGLVVGMVVSEDFQQFAGIAQQGLALLFLKFGRDAESQSDRLGVEYSTKIGYDANNMANFFRTINRLQEQSGQSIPTFLSTHPNPLDRYQRVEELADEWQKKVDAKDLEVNRESYLRMIDGLVYGEDPRQGYVEEGMFYHPEMKFQFPVPGGWQTNNMPTQVQMAPEDGKALLLLTLSQEKSLQEAGQAALEQYELELRKTEDIQVNGLPARIITADNLDQEGGQNVRVLITLIQYDGTIYQFLGASLQEDFQTYYPIFYSTTRNFRKLTDLSKINVEPERIRIRTVESSGTLEQVLSSFGVPAERMNEFAILNSMELDATVEPGTLIKTIGK